MARKVQYIIIKSETTVFLNSCCAACCGPPPAEDVGGARAPAAVAKVCAWRGAAVAANCSASVKARWPGRRRVASLEAPLQRLQQNIAEYRNFESHTKECFPEVEKDEQRKLEELSGLTAIGELRFHSGLKEDVEELRFFTSESGNEQISIKQYVDRMKVGQMNIYYAKGRDFIDVEGSLCVEMARMQGGEVLYVLDPVAKKAVEQLKEFDGKKLMSVLGEEECGDDDDAGDELVEYEQQSEWGDSGYSEDWVRRELCEIQAAEEEEEDDEYMDEADDDDGD